MNTVLKNIVEKMYIKLSTDKSYTFVMDVAKHFLPKDINFKFIKGPNMNAKIANTFTFVLKIFFHPLIFYTFISFLLQFFLLVSQFDLRLVVNLQLLKNITKCRFILYM